MGLDAEMPEAPRAVAGGGSAEGLQRLVRAVRSLSPGGQAPAAVDALVKAHRAIYPKADLGLLTRAYVRAELLHRPQIRKSGEPYITHPLAVAQILAELGMDTVTLVAALLHDTVEDTSYTLEELCREFGGEVGQLVDGVTKFDKVFFGDAAEAETIRKLIIAAGRDVRVLVIKLADRVHNMRTLGFTGQSSRIRKATATLEVLVPLADRLGIHVFKRELEDLALAHLEPQRHAQIERYIRSRSDRTAYINRVVEAIRQQLRGARVHALVTARPRHISSIFQEMRKRGLDQPHDPPRVVAIVSGPNTDCYAALGAVHGLWRPVPGRFKDFIASPKFNLYQSLHTTVIGPENEPVEVLIRTEAMHRVAEYGIAGQFREQAKRGDGSSAAHQQQMAWLSRLLAWQGNAVDPNEFLTSLRNDLTYEQIQVFTTRGDKVLLGASSSIVDLAYTLDPALGDRLIGAYVNGHLVPLSSTLADGDVVEIISAEGSDDYPGPSREWLSFVRSPQAQIQISQWFARRGEERKALHDKIKLGRSAIALALARRERALATEAPLMDLAVDLGYPDGDALFVAVSDGTADADEVVERLIASVDRPDSEGYAGREAVPAWRTDTPLS